MENQWRKPYVHDAAVDIAKLFEAEKAGAMRRVVEDIALNPSSAM